MPQLCTRDAPHPTHCVCPQCPLCLLFFHDCGFSLTASTARHLQIEYNDMLFTQELWSCIEDSVIPAIMTSPFMTEMVNGTLDEAIFRFERPC